MINHASIIAFMKAQGTLVIIGFVGTYRFDYLTIYRPETWGKLI